VETNGIAASHIAVEAVAADGRTVPLRLDSGDHHEGRYVLDGEISLITADGEVRLGAGEAAFAPRGVPHCYRVESDTARWIVSTTDGGFASFIEAASVPAENDGFAPVEQLIRQVATATGGCHFVPDHCVQRSASLSPLSIQNFGSSLKAWLWIAGLVGNSSISDGSTFASFAVTP